MGTNDGIAISQQSKFEYGSRIHNGACRAAPADACPSQAVLAGGEHQNNEVLAKLHGILIPNASEVLLG